MSGQPEGATPPPPPTEAPVEPQRKRVRFSDTLLPGASEQAAAPLHASARQPAAAAGAALSSSSVHSQPVEYLEHVGAVSAGRNPPEV